MSGRRSRDKGDRTERGVVELMRAAGFDAQRIPLSGSCGGRFVGDVVVPMMGQDRRWEVKCRATGFRQLYGWLADHYGLILKADRERPLAVLPLETLLSIISKAGTGEDRGTAGGQAVAVHRT